MLETIVINIAGWFSVPSDHRHVGPGGASGAMTDTEGKLCGIARHPGSATQSRPPLHEPDEEVARTPPTPQPLLRGLDALHLASAMSVSQT